MFMYSYVVSVLALLCLGLVAGLNETTVQVVPEAVDPDSVVVDGEWDHFNISWRRSSVNHGEVYYKVLMAYNQNGKEEEVSTVSTDNICIC